MGVFRSFSIIRGIAAILFSLALVVYLGFLLYSQYRYQSELQQYALSHMLADVENRSTAAGYFFAERADDMTRLAERRELLVYFENLALGMSMEYGLSASLMEAESAFKTFIETRKLADRRIYSRLVFLDSSGEALIDVSENASTRTNNGGSVPSPLMLDGESRETWKKLVTKEPGRAGFLAEGKGRQGVIILSLPYLFKGVYSGQILAMIHPGLVYDHFLAESDSIVSKGPAFALVYNERYLFTPDSLLCDRLPSPSSLAKGKAYEFSMNGDDGSSVLINAYLTPISGTPFSLTAFISANDEKQPSSPKTMILVTGWIGIVILGGTFIIIRTSMKNAVLKATQDQIMHMNVELEQRVMERTADIEASNQKVEEAYADLKAAQSQMLQQEKMASIGQLAAGVAHEINNPIGFMLSNLGTLGKYAQRLLEFGRRQSELIEALVKGASADPQTVIEEMKTLRKTMKIDRISDDILSLIDESKEGGERVKKIVLNLKSFARLDEAEYQETDINEGIDSTINIVWNELKYKADLKKEYGDLPKLKCYSSQLNQVFMNILVNATQAIDKHGEITVHTWHDAGCVYIAISDTGCGMPPEVARRIFEPFYTTKEVGKGTGLGMSISYDIIKKHNGRIRMDSEVGKGTTFTIELPIPA